MLKKTKLKTYFAIISVTKIFFLHKKLSSLKLHFNQDSNDFFAIFYSNRTNFSI